MVWIKDNRQGGAYFVVSGSSNIIVIMIARLFFELSLINKWKNTLSHFFRTLKRLKSNNINKYDNY